MSVRLLVGDTFEFPLPQEHFWVVFDVNELFHQNSGLVSVSKLPILGGKWSLFGLSDAWVGFWGYTYKSTKNSWHGSHPPSPFWFSRRLLRHSLPKGDWCQKRFMCCTKYIFIKKKKRQFTYCPHAGHWNEMLNWSTVNWEECPNIPQFHRFQKHPKTKLLFHNIFRIKLVSYHWQVLHQLFKVASVLGWMFLTKISLYAGA